MDFLFLKLSFLINVVIMLNMMCSMMQLEKLLNTMKQGFFFNFSIFDLGFFLILFFILVCRKKATFGQLFVFSFGQL